MNPRNTSHRFLSLLAICFLASDAVADAAERVALVVGISNYPKDGALATLPNPVNDAKLVASALERAKFSVTLATDATRGQFKAKLDEFVDSVQAGGAAVVYFAGHGMQNEGKNYLLAANAKMMRKYDLGEESVEADTLLNAIADKRPQTALVFLDCCRTPPTSSWLASGKERSALRSGLANMQHSDLLIQYAAAPGQPALDGTGANSPYATALARQITTGAELTELLKSVTREVLIATNQRQRPYQTGSLLDNFFFIPGGSSLPGSPAPALITPSLSVPTGITPVDTGLRFEGTTLTNTRWVMVDSDGAAHHFDFISGTSAKYQTGSLTNECEYSFSGISFSAPVNQGYAQLEGRVVDGHLEGTGRSTNIKWTWKAYLK